MKNEKKRKNSATDTGESRLPAKLNLSKENFPLQQFAPTFFSLEAAKWNHIWIPCHLRTCITVKSPALLFDSSIAIIFCF